MQNKILRLVIILLVISNLQSLAQNDKLEKPLKKHFIGSSMFVLMNLSPKNRPDFFQLNYGYRFTQKDAISLEVKTWKYNWPLGIPYGKSYETPEEEFPGYIRERGFALVYQRFLWKRFYSSVHIMNAWQNFVNTDGNKIDNGFQIFNTYRIGYQFNLFKNKIFFIEPSLAITHRLYHTDMPKEFKRVDDRWPKFFFGEPGLHFGFNF